MRPARKRNFSGEPFWKGSPLLYPDREAEPGQYGTAGFARRAPTVGSGVGFGARKLRFAPAKRTGQGGATPALPAAHRCGEGGELAIPTRYGTAVGTASRRGTSAPCSGKVNVPSRGPRRSKLRTAQILTPPGLQARRKTLRVSGKVSIDNTRRSDKIKRNV